MFGSEILEIVIGLIFIYLLLSLLATTLNEIILSNIMSLRGRLLQKAIRSMLSDTFDPAEDLSDQPAPKGEDVSIAPAPVKDLGVAFYEHPLIYRLAKKGKLGRPSYISRENFAQVVMAILTDESTIKQTFEDLEAGVKRLPFGGTKKILMTLLNYAEGDILKFKAAIEKWFDEMMDRATGWYKRKVQLILIGIGLILSIIFNADTFQITKKLAADPDARAKIVTMAEQYQAHAFGDITTDSSQNRSAYALHLKRQCANATDSIEKQYYCKQDSLNQKLDYLVHDQLDQAGNILGLGWSQVDWQGKSFGQHVKSAFASLITLAFWLKFLGWCLTALAVSLGAPFWFDLLNTFMKIRGTGRKPEEKVK